MVIGRKSLWSPVMSTRQLDIWLESTDMGLVELVFILQFTVSHRIYGEGNGTPLQYSWKIPWMEEPGRLQSTGSLRVGHD